MSILKIMIPSLVGIYTFLVLALYFFQENFIFLPTPLDKEHVYKLNTPFEELSIEMEDGAIINALHLKAENPKGIIYYHHGNAGNLDRWGQIAAYFIQFQYDVLIYDYRGYGKSTGTRSEANLHKDAEHIHELLLEDWKEDQIILYGRSIGSGIASQLAANHSAKMLILETPFYSLKSIASYRFPFLPTGLLVKYDFPNANNLQNADMPIHIFHGTEDKIIPYTSGKRLYESVQEKATFTTISGGYHNNLIEFTTYQEGIKELLQ